jgi:hypothetical protein
MLARYEWAKKLQDDGQFSREQPQHELALPAYQIGRYPVTNAEYAAYVEATGRDAPRHWREGRFPEELADHPVVNVTWRDALAYVQWLAERAEQPYRLPTEAEWEKAARGDDGRLWPWGDEWDPARANCQPEGPKGTTPVGQYSAAGGDSPCGAADMAGNVWEWCSSLWGNDPNKPSFVYPYRATTGGRTWRQEACAFCAAVPFTTIPASCGAGFVPGPFLLVRHLRISRRQGFPSIKHPDPCPLSPGPCPRRGVWGERSSPQGEVAGGEQYVEHSGLSYLSFRVAYGAVCHAFTKKRVPMPCHPERSSLP